MSDATLGTVEISALIESSSNPRRNLNGPELAELVQSVKEHGVLQPILVRRLPAGAFEIVAGHRRVAAARKAALLTVPAMFRTLTDKQVLEIQIIENLQRSDLHPLEEADGYRQLIDKHGYTAEQLADRVGKSKGYVYARMKLVALVKTPRAAFLEGKLDASTALLIARMPEQLQEKATKEILTGGGRFGDGEPMTYRAAAEHVREHFMLKLAAAPFDPKDAELVKAAGPCGSCPKRTGNQPELFGDVKSADVCTDPICFKAKSEASWRLRAAEAKAAGRLVIEGVLAKKLFPWGQGDLRDDKFIDLKAAARDLGEYQRTWSQIIGKKLHPAKLILARDPEGRVHELVKRTDLPEILKAAGVKKKAEPSYRGGGDESWRKQQAKQAREAKARKVRGRAMVEAVLAKAAEKSFDVDGILPIIAEGMLSHSWHDCVAETVRRRGIEIPNGQGPENGLRKVIADLAEKDRTRFYRELVLELVITRAMPQTYNPSPGRELQVAAKIYGIDLKKVGDRAVAEIAKPTAGKKAKK